MALPIRPGQAPEPDKGKKGLMQRPVLGSLPLIPPVRPVAFTPPVPEYDDVENETEYGDEEVAEVYSNTDYSENNTDYSSEEEYDDEDEDDEIGQELAALSDEVADAVELLIEEIMSDESSEVIMNGPDSIHCKRNGQRVHLTEINFGDVKTYHHVINKFILEFCDTKERINDSSYLVEGQLQLEDPQNPEAPPMVARVHVVAPPAVKFAKVTIAKKARRQFTLEDIYNRGSMSVNMFEFLKAISRAKITTVFSGLSGSGKTTLVEAISHYFDPDDRIIVAEDTPELKFPLPDVVYMVSSKPKPGDSVNQKPITLEWLVQQANRMRPDRIIVGETRGSEMAEFLVAANSGADGSMTTLHAQDPERALSKMANLASKGSENRSENSVIRDIAGTVQLIVQMSLIDGRHVITHITEVSDVVNQTTGKISLTPLFEYDRKSDQWINKGRPSENLKGFMSARGVPINLSWFQR